MKYLRQFGGSLGAVLETLGKAMQSPGTKVPIIDIILLVNGNDSKHTLELKKKAERIINSLNLKNIYVNIENNRCFIFSKNYGYRDDSGEQATANDWSDEII